MFTIKINHNDKGLTEYSIYSKEEALEEKLDFQKAEQILKERNPNDKLQADPRLHADTKLWAALQNISGGTWGGCVFDTEKIIKTLHAGQKALNKNS